MGSELDNHVIKKEQKIGDVGVKKSLELDDPLRERSFMSEQFTDNHSNRTFSSGKLFYFYLLTVKISKLL